MSKVLNLKNGNTERSPFPEKINSEINPAEIGILIFCDFNCVTGFSNVANQFIVSMQRDSRYRIVIHAINDFSKAPYESDEQTMVFPARLNKENDPYGRLEFLRRVNEIDFDFVFVLNDIEIIAQLLPHFQIIKAKKKKENRKVFKTVTYFPVDSIPLASDVSEFHKIDLPITYTKYGKKIISKLNPMVRDKIKILPHGVSLLNFFKIEDKEVIKKQKRMIFGKKNENAFIFGSVNRNSARKDMGCILLAFASIKQIIDTEEMPVLLYLHCNPKDPKGLDMERACLRLNLTIGKDVFFPKNFNENTGFSIHELNIRYNVMDVFISTTTAEGWGLTITEAMATKTPVICPLHTSLKEVTKKGKLVEPLVVAHESVFLSDFENIRYVCDPKELVRRSIGVYNAIYDKDSEEENILNQRIEKAHKFVSKLDWFGISKEFKELIESEL